MEFTTTNNKLKSHHAKGEIQIDNRENRNHHKDGEKKLPQGINLDICFEDYNLIRPNFIPEYTEYQIDGLKVYLNHIKYFLDKKKDFNRDHLMILKLGINKVKRSEFNDMSLMIPIIIDLMNFIDLIKVDLFNKKSKDFIKVYYGWSFIKDLRKSFGGKINNINVSEKFISDILKYLYKY